MRYARLIEEASRTPWAILPSSLTVLAHVLMRSALQLEPESGVREQVAADVEARAQRRDQAAAMAGDGIAVLPIYGIFSQHSGVQDVSGPGMVSADAMTGALSMLASDDSVSGIVLDIDSPGGAVYGVPELADHIKAVERVKPVYAVANATAASAAYWVGSQANKLFVTPSGQAGSIGVYAAHEDLSKALDAEGRKVSLISAGKYKTEGNPFEPLSADARAHVQAQVDDFYGQFTRDVARGRNVPVDQVRSSMGEGRLLNASAAKAAGMVDGVATLPQVIATMRRDLAMQRSPAARHAMRSRELEILGG